MWHCGRRHRTWRNRHSNYGRETMVYQFGARLAQWRYQLGNKVFLVYHKHSWVTMASRSIPQLTTAHAQHKLKVPWDQIRLTALLWFARIHCLQQSDAASWTVELLGDNRLGLWRLYHTIHRHCHWQVDWRLCRSEKADDHSRSPPAHEEHNFEKESHRGLENFLWLDSTRKDTWAAYTLT